MKKITALTLTLILIACFSTPSADAGAARRHTIEGFILGTGAVIIGTAIIHGLNKDQQPSLNRQPSRKYKPSHNYSRQRKHQSYRHHRRYAKHSAPPRGHWKIREVWIADKYKERWNPGHYNPRGTWVEGRYTDFLVRKGHWQTQKIWIPR